MGASLIPAAAAAAQPGPRLQEPAPTLERALECTRDVDAGQRTPVLLVHGTSSTPEEVWGPTYARWLPAAGYPVCTVRIPVRAFDDVQRNVEYVVHATRRLAQRSRRRIAIVGYSQGAWLATYALRFWPDLARKVDDVVGFAGLYTYGSDVSVGMCASTCPMSYQQARPGSRHMTALASRPLPEGPSYTSYITLNDELVTPQPKASTLVAPGVRNYVLQDMCPGDTTGHIALPHQRPLLALTLDALAHPGPAARERVGAVTCGADPEAQSGGNWVVTSAPDILVQGAGVVSTTEAPLRCYMDAGCARPRLAPDLRVATTPRRDRRAPFAFATTGTLTLPKGSTRDCDGTVTVIVTRGRRALASQRVPLVRGTSPLGEDCAFRSTIVLGRRALPRGRTRGGARLQVRYHGATEVLPLRLPSWTLRLG